MPEDFGAMRSYTDVTRRYAVGFAILMASLLVIACAALISIALKQNVAQVELNTSSILRSVSSKVQSTGTALKDYAFWNDAYASAGGDTVDVDWAYERDNMGGSLFNSYSIDGVFIVGPAQDTRYAVVEGELSSVTATQYVSADLTPLLAAARDRADLDQAVYGYYLVNGAEALVYAASIKSDEVVGRAALANTSVMLFVDILDIEALGLDAKVADLRTVQQREDGLLFVSLQSAFGEELLLTWTPTRPGDAFLLALLPLLVLTAVLFAVLLWALQRRLLRASGLFDAGQDALLLSEERFRSVAESSSDWIWETDTHGRLTFVSGRFSVMTGLQSCEWAGKKLGDLLGVDIAACSAPTVSAEHAPAARQQIECSYADALGSMHHCLLSIRSILKDGDVCGYRGTVTDITEEVEAKRQITHMSEHDALTGLANRRYLHTYLDTRLGVTSRPLCLLSLDLDRFKPVNDTFGHSIGDQVLCEVALRLKHCVREGDVVARLGGDEFVLVIEGLADERGLERLCAQVCEAIGEPIVSGAHEISLGVSIGVAIAPKDAVHAGDLLRYADIALYEAKAAGRNNWQFYAAEMNQRVIDRRLIETDLRNALRRSEFFLEFQPRFSVGAKVVSGAEALVRWQHPVRGRTMPDHFISVAEETGLVIALSDWVLEKACKAATEWPAELLISVNLSSVEFQRGDLIARVRRVLEATGLDAGRLELEITETVMLRDSASALEIMIGLKRLGVRLSMDDFGTGYSSLSYLRTYPFDAIKIDRSFIADLQGETKSTAIAILESIIGLGRALAMTVTAEGIESESQLKDLASIRCDEAQGHYLGRPQSLQQFNALIAARHQHAAVAIAPGPNAAIDT